VAVTDGGAHENDIIQVGIIKCIDGGNPQCDGSTDQFVAWGRSNTVSGCGTLSNVRPVPAKVGDFPGGSWKYTVFRNAQQWFFQINGQNVGPNPSLASICWAKKWAVWSGESWDRGDAIGGPVDNPFNISQAIYEATVGGVWSNANWGSGNVCNLAPTLARYKCDAPTGTSLNLWTVQP